MSVPPAWADIVWRQQPIQIEYQWVGADRPGAPWLVFLHEGLGSVAMWRDFPAALCAAVGCRGLVYSRPGYGRSTPRAPTQTWGLDFMHRQAQDVLPALLRALGIDTAAEPPWLFGHSDGGSIALLHAASFPERVAGSVVMAPHIFVEDISVASIEQAARAYMETDLRQRIARYHDDPDSAFWGWNRAWLSAPFRAWNIQAELGAIRCPVLAVQGVEDEYGTLAQIRGIAQRAPQTQLLELAACGHSPHKDQADALIAAVHRFYSSQHR